MVLTPALVIPDEQSLTIWGHDPRSNGLEPTWSPGSARVLLSADPLPRGLEVAVADLRAGLPRSVPERLVRVPTLAWPGAEGAQDVASTEHAGHEAHAGHHDGHDHGDMMAIVGDPSADGLVMEAITTTVGPLAPGLPGGLVLAVELDGDIVASCDLTIALTLGADAASATDPLAPAGWAAALGGAVGGGGGWDELVAVELERALSHLCWMRGLCRLLGWAVGVDRCVAAVRALLRAREARTVAVIEAAIEPVSRVRGLTEQRRLAMRLEGRGVVDRRFAPALHGPAARAIGDARDARVSDARYAHLGFVPVTADGGDALARARVRAGESVDALLLAARALRESGEAPERSVPVEGPRGPLLATRTAGRLRTSAPGCAAALTQAGESAVGLEWASALVAVASFDLSPWRVSG